MCNLHAAEGLHDLAEVCLKQLVVEDAQVALDEQVLLEARAVLRYRCIELFQRSVVATAWSDERGLGTVR